MVHEFYISPNDFLHQQTIIAWYSMEYTGFRKPNNPDFLNVLKNTFGDIPGDASAAPAAELDRAESELQKVLVRDLAVVQAKIGVNPLAVVCVPRSKANMHENQLRFRRTLSRSISSVDGLVDLSCAVVRHTNTRTTHIKKSMRRENDGAMPYPGITRETCTFTIPVSGKDVLVVDDIYTFGVNIDEDAIQAMFDEGARNVYFYSVAKTVYQGG